MDSLFKNVWRDFESDPGIVCICSLQQIQESLLENNIEDLIGFIPNYNIWVVLNS